MYPPGSITTSGGASTGDLGRHDETCWARLNHDCNKVHPECDVYHEEYKCTCKPKVAVDRGDWITTFTGKRFYPLDPKVKEIDVNDIMHALSNQCRFAGHCTEFYSVAQHCVLVSHMCDPQDALWGLIHDASEAYLVDVPSPMKKSATFEAYRKAEKRVMDTICEAFGLPSDGPPSVKAADKRVLATEARDLTLSEGRGWASTAEPYDFHIKPWSPAYARAKYLGRLHELTINARTK